MPFGFADHGIRCGQCGHSASYPKSAICSDRAIINDKASVVRWAPLVLAVLAIIFLLGLIATRARSAERVPLHIGEIACKMGYIT